MGGIYLPFPPICLDSAFPPICLDSDSWGTLPEFTCSFPPSAHSAKQCWGQQWNWNNRKCCSQDGTWLSNMPAHCTIVPARPHRPPPVPRPPLGICGSAALAAPGGCAGTRACCGALQHYCYELCNTSRSIWYIINVILVPLYKQTLYNLTQYVAWLRNVNALRLISFSPYLTKQFWVFESMDLSLTPLLSTYLSMPVASTPVLQGHGVNPPWGHFHKISNAYNTRGKML